MSEEKGRKSGLSYLGAPETPRGPRVDDDHAPSPLPGPQPSLSPAQQHLESPVPSAPEALAGGPTQAAPGVRGEEEEWAREIGAQLRRMADDLNAQYERRVSAGRRAGGEGYRTPPPDVPQLLAQQARGRAGDRQMGVCVWEESDGSWVPGWAGSGAEPQAGSEKAARSCCAARSPRPRGLRAALGAAAPISQAIYSR